MKAVKNDKGKTKMGLVPPFTLWEVAETFTHGARKYAPYNYLNGMDHSRLIDAGLRHLQKYLMGIDYDNGKGGSKKHHLACAISNFMMLRESIILGKGKDDRMIKTWSTSSRKAKKRK